MSKPSFSLHGFKKWISEQKDLSEFFNVEIEDELVGKRVMPKFPSKKLLPKIRPQEDSNAEDILEEFITDGGVIVEVSEKVFIIEVDSGNFKIPKFCVEIVE